MQHKKPTYFSVKKAIIPIAIGVGTAAYLLWKANPVKAFSELTWSSQLLLGFFLTASVIFIRDLGYTIRLKAFVQEKISWIQAFQVILLWEFGSAVSPGMIGGKAVATYLLSKSGIPVGRATSFVLFATFLDELIFICVFPILWWALHGSILHIDESCSDLSVFLNTFSVLKGNLYLISSVAKSLLLTLFGVVLLLGFGLFVKPQILTRILLFIGKFPFFNRWHKELENTAQEIIETSTELKQKNLLFWIKSLFGTFIAWAGRYLIANAIIFAFVSHNMVDNLMIYARQYVVWMFFYIPATPGSSGIAEIVFITLMCSYIPVGLSSIVAILWRFFSYYVYLVIGIFLLPFYYGKYISNKA